MVGSCSKVVTLTLFKLSVLCATLGAGEMPFTPPLCTYPELSTSDWAKIAPYLLPNNHPVKPKLDKIFSKQRFLNSKEALEEAHFKVRGPGSGHTLVAKHKKLPDVLLKLYTDDQPIDELNSLYKRILGLQVAKQVIKAHSFEWLFKLPRKWFYIVPEFPVATGPYPKRFVLVVEDMHILPKDENYSKWSSKSINPQKLDALYIFLTEGGFNDLPMAFNIPFAKDGRLAVVDTEDFHKWPIPYSRLDKYLSSKMKAYWHQLIDQGGPVNFNLSLPLFEKMMNSPALPPPLMPSLDDRFEEDL